MSRDFNTIEYRKHFLECDWCYKKQSIGDGAATPDGWHETDALYKEVKSRSDKPSIIGTGWPDRTPGASYSVAFCCKEHEDLYWAKYDASDIATPGFVGNAAEIRTTSITFGGHLD